MNELSYSLGVSVGMNLKEQGFELDCIDDFAKALNDVLNGNDLAIPQDKVGQIVNEYFTNLQKVRFQEKIDEGKNFLEENKKKDGVVELPSGLQYKVINEGTGAKPKAEEQVTVHYHGTLIDGTVFDSSVKRDQPATFPVNGVIPGWVEALQLMPEGSKWELYIPSELAYGERGAGQLIGPYSTLIFEVELIKIG